MIRCVYFPSCLAEPLVIIYHQFDVQTRDGEGILFVHRIKQLSPVQRVNNQFGFGLDATLPRRLNRRINPPNMTDRLEYNRLFACLCCILGLLAQDKGRKTQGGKGEPGCLTATNQQVEPRFNRENSTVFCLLLLLLLLSRYVLE